MEFAGLARDELLAFDGACDVDREAVVQTFPNFTECFPEGALQLSQRVRCNEYEKYVYSPSNTLRF